MAPQILAMQLANLCACRLAVGFAASVSVDLETCKLGTCPLRFISPLTLDLNFASHMERCSLLLTSILFHFSSDLKNKSLLAQKYFSSTAPEAQRPCLIVYF